MHQLPQHRDQRTDPQRDAGEGLDGECAVVFSVTLHGLPEFIVAHGWQVLAEDRHISFDDGEPAVDLHQ